MSVSYVHKRYASYSLFAYVHIHINTYITLANVMQCGFSISTLLYIKVSSKSIHYVKTKSKTYTIYCVCV